MVRYLFFHQAWWTNTCTCYIFTVFYKALLAVTKPRDSLFLVKLNPRHVDLTQPFVDWLSYERNPPSQDKTAFRKKCIAEKLHEWPEVFVRKFWEESAVIFWDSTLESSSILMQFDFLKYIITVENSWNRSFLLREPIQKLSFIWWYLVKLNNRNISCSDGLIHFVRFSNLVSTADPHSLISFPRNVTSDFLFRQVVKMKVWQLNLTDLCAKKL